MINNSGHSSPEFVEPSPGQSTTRPRTDVILENILKELPFGIRVTNEDHVVFSNQIGNGSEKPLQPPEMENTVFVEKAFEVSVGGSPYTVSLYLDETERTSREQSLIKRAYFDDLTGLPNRQLFEQSVRTLIDSQQDQFAIAFIDVDDFKHVNDFYGHTVGDHLLIEMSGRIVETLRPSDMLARIGGDEFLLLISPVPDQTTLEEKLTAIMEQLGRHYYLGGSEVKSSVSIGVSVYPRDGSVYSKLQANADRAMYKSKADGAGRIQFFDQTIEHLAVERARLEERLRLTIEERRVTCAYQPKVDIYDDSVSGIEILMRWIDEDGVIRPPGDFIALALELDLLDQITFLILDETIQAIDQINEAFGPTASISLNIAAKQSTDLAFMRRLLQVIAESGFASRFVLEITEEALLAKKFFQDQVLPLIREIGARVSIDDFGVGYSSLSALADITADEVKIDRSFITEIHQRPRSQNILKAIEALSRSLGMSIVVEGVETFEELTYLRTCTTIRLVQGYYFSKPILLSKISSVSNHHIRPPLISRPIVEPRSFRKQEVHQKI